MYDVIIPCFDILLQCLKQLPNIWSYKRQFDAGLRSWRTPAKNITFPKNPDPSKMAILRTPAIQVQPSPIGGSKDSWGLINSMVNLNPWIQGVTDFFKQAINKPIGSIWTYIGISTCMNFVDFYGIPMLVHIAWNMLPFPVEVESTGSSGNPY